MLNLNGFNYTVPGKGTTYSPQANAQAACQVRRTAAAAATAAAATAAPAADGAAGAVAAACAAT